MMNDAYLATAARNAGVPEFWVEDAIQDIKFKLWKGKQEDNKLFIRTAAIDAARKYGRRTKSGDDRLLCESIEHNDVGTDNIFNHMIARWELMDVIREFSKLSIRRKRALFLSIFGVGGTNKEHVAAYEARKILSKCRII